MPGDTLARIRQARAEVSQAPDLLGPAWQELIIGELLRYPASVVRDSAALATEFRDFRPDAVAGPDGSVTRLHVYRRGFDEPLTDSVHGAPALAERAAQLCRDTRVPLALLRSFASLCCASRVLPPPTAADGAPSTSTSSRPFCVPAPSC